MKLWPGEQQKLLDIIAMAGGGGSSSGGGGGGGGSSSSSSSSGSSSSSSGGGGGPTSPIEAAIMFATFGVMVFIFIFVARSKLFGEFSARLHAASRARLKNPTPEQQTYIDLFKQYQHDWQEKNLSSIKTYTTPEYYKRAGLMLLALEQLHRKNRVEIKAMRGADIKELGGGKVAVVFVCDAVDTLIDEQTNKTLNTNHFTGYTETWIFQTGAKDAGDDTSAKPLLDAINPATIAPHTLRAEMRDFAEANKLFYSPDWGTLTLPRRGTIFAKSTFQTADINNHCIGLYEAHLIQLYTYSPTVNTQVNGAPYPQYLVGQIAVPKNYGGILIMPNKLIDRRPKGYQKYQLEWGEFNNRYDVFATDLDKIASFELLNPGFMEFLHDQVNFKVAIEVVDNIIYFYTKGAANTKPQNYKTMLEILRRAYKELKS